MCQLVIKKKTINVVWLKRDLRLKDHQPIFLATQEVHPFILLYIYEPSLIQNEHTDERHWRFVGQSLSDIDKSLQKQGQKLSIAYGEARDIFSQLVELFDVKNIYSHEESGLSLTYLRDQELNKLFKKFNINWFECQSNAVIRGLNNRKTWDKEWAMVMRKPLIEIDISQLNILSYEFNTSKLDKIKSDNNFQAGGFEEAHKVMTDFFNVRGRDYYKFISKPELSRISCSRLSPYISYGNLSIRQIYHEILNHWSRSGWRRSMIALSSRIHWHCHFIQKFESQISIEQKTINPGYQDFPYLVNNKDHPDFLSWKSGQTGYPMIDACMRALMFTGYVNFRMRAMLVSFACHYYRIHWKMVAITLGRYFLDFEPGIHYPQIQMQAGVTGINTIRVYNPVKQAIEHDPDAIFIKKWIPELRSVDVESIHSLPINGDDLFISNNNYIGAKYNFQDRVKESKKLLFLWKKSNKVKQNNHSILKMHVRI